MERRMSTLGRGEYAARYGPTTGDRVRLADTDLWVVVEGDDVFPGDELLGGCGKTARDGVLVTSAPAAGAGLRGAGRGSALDLIIPNVLVLDPVLGVRKTSIGIAGGRIVGTGRAGNPDVQAGVDLVVDSHTAIVPGEGLIATAGLIDSHVHASSPQIAAAALSSGITTVVAMGVGGVWDVGANPVYNLRAMMAGWAGIPLNAAFLARGSTRSAGLLEAAVEAGAGGFKVHEDWGAIPAQIDTCLTVAEAAGLPVALHTDTLNESGYLADTVAATAGRTVHAYHVEGGGGHPDVLEIINHPHVLGSSTTPTLPLTPATIAELVPMTMTVHKLHARLGSDSAIARSRVRQHGIAAENRLHDLGAIPIINSDSMGMGRIAEVARRTWQLAHVQATLAGEAGPSFANNERVLRYLAKITLNPAIAHGLAAHVGSLTAGRLADIVLWDPARFGSAPELVLKSGFVAWGVSGSGSGSTRITQPRVLGPFFGGLGDAPRHLSAQFVAEPLLSDAALRAALPTGISYLPIAGARGLTRADMARNSLVPRVSVPVSPGPVTVDGVPVPVHEAGALPLTRLHHLG
jgi:urease subunit alpha